MDDGKIVDMFLMRDERAIAALREKYGLGIKRVAMNTGLCTTDAEEIENDTLFAVWNRIPPHEPRSYLFFFAAKIAREKAINRIKTAGRLKRSASFVELSDEMEQLIPSPDDTESEIDKKLFTEAVNTFLRSLSSEKRCVFIRRYWFMESIEAISERYGMSEGKVKSLLFRVRKELGKYLEKEGFQL